MKHSGTGLALLSLSAWLRQQKWLRFFFQHLPQGLRDRVSALLAARALASARFARTPAWDRFVVPAPSKSREPAGQVGVNILGYLRGQFGLAESARMYARALISAGVPVSLFDIDLKLRHGWNDRSLDAWIGDDLPHPISILFVNPDMLQPALQHIGQARLQGRYLIGCWFWELETVPAEWLSAIQEVDEILVASKFVEDAFRRVTDKPILRVPLPLSYVADSGLQRADFGLEEECFTFLCTFDFNSWIARKNPFAVVEAFRLAFANKGDSVRLLIKTSNGFRHPEKFHQLLALINRDRRIMVRDDIIDGDHVRALHRCCDAYISLHRAEGFGLGLAEMMLAGKPVIATRWSGNLEFMDDDNSCLVGCQMVRVAEGDYLGSTDQQWAEADTAEAAEWMCRLVTEPGLAAQLGAKARDSVRRTLSPEHAAETISNHLALIRQRLPTIPYIHAPAKVFRGRS
ncbi:glycosyltransferase family 4 protein [Lysobacter sp. H21R4]|uniref:glycosyltransferase family 4 protein n=1 Tax=Lysobacter sp. H21R4 TaxID=2781021 RepID=UPI001888A8E5|nr:glycosyltransferase family 4 protein [Lysobacter sp. H21R4]QOY62391.1 glycosyltransferase family 4 protein [Lysobacter sp. H21R4]